MKPITLTPIFARIFDAMNERDRRVAYFLDGSCAPTAQGAGTFQINVSSGTFIVNNLGFQSFAGGNVTPAALVNPQATRCDLVHISAAGALTLTPGVEVVVTPSTPAVPPAIPAGAAAIALAYITPGSVDYGAGSSSFVEDIRQINEPPLFRDGTFSAPSMVFGAETATGLYRVGTGVVGVAGSALALGTNPATAGILRLPVSDGAGTQFITQRNQANSNNLFLLGANTSDQVQMNPALNVLGAFLALGSTPATADLFRIPNNQYVTARNAANSNNQRLLRLGADDIEYLYADTVKISGSGDLTVLGSFVAVGTNPALSGGLRLPNNTLIEMRNAANSADQDVLKLSAADVILLGNGGALALTLASSNLQVGQSGGSIGFYGGTLQAKGANNSVLTVVSGTVQWATPAGVHLEAKNSAGSVTTESVTWTSSFAGTPVVTASLVWGTADYCGVTARSTTGATVQQAGGVADVKMVHGLEAT